MSTEQQYLARIAELEKTLRWIVKTCDVRINRVSLFDEIKDRASASLRKKEPA